MLKKGLLAPVDEFTFNPLLSLLPVIGETAKIDALGSSLYARLEKVQRSREQTADSNRANRPYAAEEQMLECVLEWISARQINNGAR